MEPVEPDGFVDWHTLAGHRMTAIREKLCTCCAAIHRAGDPWPRPVRAVCWWVCRNGNRELLCQGCLRIWRDTASEDVELQPVEVLML